MCKNQRVGVETTGIGHDAQIALEIAHRRETRIELPAKDIVDIGNKLTERGPGHHQCANMQLSAWHARDDTIARNEERGLPCLEHDVGLFPRDRHAGATEIAVEHEAIGTDVGEHIAR